MLSVCRAESPQANCRSSHKQRNCPLPLPTPTSPCPASPSATAMALTKQVSRWTDGTFYRVQLSRGTRVNTRAFVAERSRRKR